MKNYELLDMIGDVNEDYVQAADSNVVRPRFQWKALAACAACAALVLCAYPVWQGVKSNSSTADTALPAAYSSYITKTIRKNHTTNRHIYWIPYITKNCLLPSQKILQYNHIFTNINPFMGTEGNIHEKIICNNTGI